MTTSLTLRHYSCMTFFCAMLRAPLTLGIPVSCNTTSIQGMPNQFANHLDVFLQRTIKKRRIAPEYVGTRYHPAIYQPMGSTSRASSQEERVTQVLCRLQTTKCCNSQRRLPTPSCGRSPGNPCRFLFVHYPRSHLRLLAPPRRQGEG